MIIFDIDIPYVNIVGLQTKGKFPCPVCGPKIKYRLSKILRKEVFDEYRHFLSKNHRYRTTERNIFNGKKDIALKPRRMTPHLSLVQKHGFFHGGFPRFLLFGVKSDVTGTRRRCIHAGTLSRRCIHA